MSNNTPSERDLELLSAYLDGELTDREREALEKRLAQDGTLRATLQSLRDTVALVRDLPPLKAPRNFTLDPAVYGRPVRWWQRWFTLGTVLQISGALGAAASMVLIVAAFLLSSQEAAPQLARDEAVSVGFVAQTASPSPAVQPTLLSTPTLSPTQESFVVGEVQQEETFALDSASVPTASPLPPTPAAFVSPSQVEAGEAAANSAAPPAMENAPAGAPLGTPTRAVQPGTSGLTSAVTASPVPMIAEPQEAPAADMLKNQTATVPENAPAPTALAAAPDDGESETAPSAEVAQSSRDQDDEERERVDRQEAKKSEETRPLWWLAGLGLVTLALSLGMLGIGYRRARRR